MFHTLRIAFFKSFTVLFIIIWKLFLNILSRLKSGILVGKGKISISIAWKYSIKLSVVWIVAPSNRKLTFLGITDFLLLKDKHFNVQICIVSTNHNLKIYCPSCWNYTQYHNFFSSVLLLQIHTFWNICSHQGYLGKVFSHQWTILFSFIVLGFMLVGKLQMD